MGYVAEDRAVKNIFVICDLSCHEGFGWDALCVGSNCCARQQQHYSTRFQALRRIRNHRACHRFIVTDLFVTDLLCHRFPFVT